MSVDINKLKKLRLETKVSIADCKKALEESDYDYKKALVWLRSNGIEKADKKSTRGTASGNIECYIHQDGKIGVMLKLLCETDFVARTDEFKSLAHELSMQIAAMNPQDVKSLLNQAYIRDMSITIGDLVKEVIAKLGENIKIDEFVRFEI